MNLKLKNLQDIVKETIKKEKAAQQLMREAVQVFGPSVDVSNDPKCVFIAVNDQLSIMESRGEDLPINSLRVSTLLAAVSLGREARKIAARLLPEKYAIKFLLDTDVSVRCAIANRLSVEKLNAAVLRFPNDDALATIVRKKKIFEAKIPAQKSKDKYFDMYGDSTIGEMLDGYEPEDLTDGWYKRTALQIFSDYKGRFDGNWRYLAVSRLCSSIYATTGVKVDAMKLRELLDEVCENSGSFQESFSFGGLKDKLMLESITEEINMFPILEESFFEDPVKDLLHACRASFINLANETFSVTHDTIEESFASGEMKEVEVPQFGKLPQNYQWNSIAEKALDRYTNSWNDRAVARGSNARLKWVHGFNTKINFKLSDK